MMGTGTLTVLLRSETGGDSNCERFSSQMRSNKWFGVGKGDESGNSAELQGKKKPILVERSWLERSVREW
jgi:hypothetical protein